MLPAVASAQSSSFFDRTVNTPVASRSHPEYEALGIDLGGFTMYPKLSVAAGYDDNIYGTEDKTGSALVTTAPSLEFASNWGRNSADIHLRYERDEYIANDSESTSEFSLTSTGRIDVDHASAITLTLNAADLYESRTAPDSVASLARPVEYDLITSGVAAYREFGRFRLEGSVTNNYYSYYNTPLLNGAIEQESLRDEDAISETLRLSYALSPNFAAFVQINPNQSQFLSQQPITSASLNSNGYSALAGVNLQLTHLLTADVGLGYLSQSYADPAIESVTGLAFNVSVQYFPTQLITVGLHADHSIQGSGVPGTPASDVNEGSLTLDYELLRNVIISPQLGLSKYDYPGTSLSSTRFTAGLNASYLINRWLGLSASYRYVNQSSSGSTGEVGVLEGVGIFNFSDNQVMLTVTLQR